MSTWSFGALRTLEHRALTAVCCCCRFRPEAGSAIFSVSKGASKSVQVLFNGTEAVLVLTLRIPKYRALIKETWYSRRMTRKRQVRDFSSFACAVVT